MQVAKKAHFRSPDEQKVGLSYQRNIKVAGQAFVPIQKNQMIIRRDS